MLSLAKGIAAAVKSYFGPAVETFSIQEISEEHPRGFSVLFTLYEYIDVRLNYELGRGGFVAASSHGGHPLGTDLLEHDLRALIERPEMLRSLDESVRLRIPDKFLTAEQWAARGSGPAEASS